MPQSAILAVDELLLNYAKNEVERSTMRNRILGMTLPRCSGTARIEINIDIFIRFSRRFRISERC